MSRIISRALLCLITLPLVTCEKVPLTAPTGSTLTLSASTTRLAANETATITAVVIEEGGTPPHNGTTVTFISTLGTMDPQEARTANGLARATFRAGTTSGTATINALSGGAQSEAAVEILVGGAGTAALVLRAEPGSVPNTGGTVAIIAAVTDDVGNRLPGVAVTFGANQGRLSPGSAVTDGNGEARASLTTNVETTVTGAAGGQTATLTVPAVDQGAIAVTLVANPNPLAISNEGQLGRTLFTATVGNVPAGDSIVRFIWNFGDARGTETTGNTVDKFYGVPGQYVARVRVITAQGREGFAETTVRVLE